MKSYSKQDIELIYQQLIKRARQNVEKKKWAKAVSNVESAAEWAYNFNLFYADADAEKLLQEVADVHIPRLNVYGGDENRCVLIDSFCLDNRGLAQQYLRAMKKKTDATFVHLYSPYHALWHRHLEGIA